MIAAPLSLYAATVPPEWIDYNGHMSEGYYVLAFGFTTDALMNYVGMDIGYRGRTGCSIYTVEAHISYLRELGPGDDLRFTTQLLGADAKRLHVFHAMYHVGPRYLAATIELMLLHVNRQQGRTTPMAAAVLAQVEAVHTAHAVLAHPPQAGRSIGL